ncbi:MAG: hypothetical protein JWO08_4725 [Verrucomicrobiaceae bacterium]|nr:hypothetical protein [Verrucomicrobiaceae bacterium]
MAGYSNNGSNEDFAVVRYNADGSVDTGFGGSGKSTTGIGSGDDRGTSGAVQSEGSIVVAGLSKDTSNYYRFALVRFLGCDTALPSIPVVSTGYSSGITATSATLNGTVNPSGLTTTARFQSGLTSYYTNTASLTLSSAYGTSDQYVSTTIGGLTSNTLYHYRITATSTAGTSNGTDLTFTTSPSANADLSGLVPGGGAHRRGQCAQLHHHHSEGFGQHGHGEGYQCSRHLRQYQRRHPLERGSQHHPHHRHGPRRHHDQDVRPVSGGLAESNVALGAMCSK